MAKLTDTQRIVLSKAAQREDGAAVASHRMNKAAVAKVGASLVARGLMREARAKSGMPVWRTDEDGRRISMIITKAGRDAIGIGDADRAPSPVVAQSAEPGSAFPSNADAPRPGSKQALLLAMLTKPKGATLSALVAATGWLPHTTRAAITGLRKRGFEIERTRRERLGSHYKIAGDRAPSVGA